ncbi:TetR/AcrR family transcriptional regulator [Alteromonadaceae bacterium M269]|nr:TetR/AcrR family transcriptional regulator [Alteromonadaceae bacterium M269]
MPRPSLAAKRKEEILDAFELCILEDSLETTSLEKLAEKADMKRSILRHYIGNRDDIIIALSERYLGYYDEQWKQTLSWLPDTNRIPVLIEILFGERNQEYIQKNIVGDALYAQAKHIPEVREHQLSSMQQSIEIMSDELAKAYPESSQTKVQLVARGILSHYLSGESLLPLGLNEEIEQLKQVSLLLLQTLDSDKA